MQLNTWVSRFIFATLFSQQAMPQVTAKPISALESYYCIEYDCNQTCRIYGYSAGMCLYGSCHCFNRYDDVVLKGRQE
ncbi:hypothetical protein CPB84DRAFT_1783036 [Gymnopilus junonius]|uniref:Defensin n=1 Tax=Gymnopilus junonius TaxID=109634 RepID=A0A9P5NMN4_GYMJU|nr:hypothetical protein CPB84DRAFT_1783036 [Gymnopilus junonius]